MPLSSFLSLLPVAADVKSERQALMWPSSPPVKITSLCPCQFTVIQKKREGYSQKNSCPWTQFGLFQIRDLLRVRGRHLKLVMNLGSEPSLETPCLLDLVEEEWDE